MGSASSNLDTSDASGLADVPENCISSVFTCFDPPEICRLARVNRSFHRASSSDFLWENKLPSNYRFLVERVIGDETMSSKKEIYARLCRPNRFDDDTKEVWLDKTSGGVFLVISPKAMKITGMDDRRYWELIGSDESRFGSVSYLKQIWWFEAVGDLEFQFPPGTYSLCFRMALGKPSRRFGRRAYNLDHVHGWDIKPVRFQLSTSDGQNALSECYLDESGKWVSYHVGEFVVENQNSTIKIKFSMLQIDCTHTKGGLCLDSVGIYPSEFREI